MLLRQAGPTARANTHTVILSFRLVDFLFRVLGARASFAFSTRHSLFFFPRSPDKKRAGTKISA